MAVAFDAVGTTGVTNASHTGGVAQTYTHTVGAGANCVVLGISIVGNGTQPWANHAPTSVTFGGTAMSFIGFRGNNNVTNAVGFVAMYKLMDPGTGAQTVSINCPLTGFWWANSVSYTGVGGVSGPNTNEGSSTNPTTGAQAGTPVVGQIVVSILGTKNVAVSANTQTSRFTQSGTSNINSGYIQDAAGAAAVTTACTANTAAWAAVAVMVNPIGAVANCNRYLTGNTNKGSAAWNVSYTISEEPDVALIVGIGMLGSGSAAWSAHQPTITFGGETLSLIGFKGNNNVTNATGFVALFGLLNPANRGAQTLSITAGASATFWWLSGVSFTQVGQIGTAVTNSGSSANPTTGAVTSVANTHLVVGMLGTFNVAVTAGSASGGSRINYWSNSATTNSESGLYDGAVATSTSVSLTATAVTAAWGTVAADLVGGNTFNPPAAALTVTGGTPTVTVAAGGVTVTPTAASLTVTGGSPRLDTGLRPTGASLAVTGGTPRLDTGLRPSGASLAVTGSSPQLDTGLRPTGAALAVTGGTPTVLTPQTFTPTGATLVVTGGSPRLDTGLRPAGVALSVTGSAPTITVSNNVTVTPTAATLVVTGGTPSLDSTIRPSSASLSVTSGTPTVTVGVIVAPTGASLAVTGGTPTIVTPVTVAPAGASLTVTGSTPRLDTGLRPTGVALAVTGGTPTVTVSNNQVVTPSAAALTITTAAPQLATALRPAGASLTVTGGTPTVTITNNKVVTPTGASLTITGGTPTVTATANRFITPTGASLTVTGAAPDVAAGGSYSKSPTAASLTVTGGTPTVTVTANRFVTPTGATLTITGGTPTVVTPQTFTPTPAALTITGGSPQLAATLRPTGATLTVAGAAPTVTVSDHQVVAPTAAALTVTGGQAAALTPIYVIPQPAALSITAGTPIVIWRAPDPPPVDRTITAVFYDRTVTARTDDRAVTAAFEDRTVTAKTETRTVTAIFDDRLVVVR